MSEETFKLKEKLIICKCSLCDDRDETVNHIISESNKLVQNKTRVT